MTLTEFLLARIAEDEVWASVALQYTESGFSIAREWKWVHLYKSTTLGSGWSSHFEGCPSPDRVLAECEAKRRIVEDFRFSQQHIDSGDTEYYPRRNVLRDVLVTLTLPYADHQDYQQEWAL